MNNGMVRTEALAARERMAKVLADTRLHLDAIEIDALVGLALDALEQAVRRIPENLRDELAGAVRARLRGLEPEAPLRRTSAQAQANGTAGVSDLEAARERNARERALREVMAKRRIQSICFWQTRDGADRRLYVETVRLGGSKRYPAYVKWCFYFDGSNRAQPGWHRESQSLRDAKVDISDLQGPEPPADVMEALAALAGGDWRNFRGRIYA